jgi:glycosyltransferase involved in cell wall biosynthesis
MTGSPISFRRAAVFVDDYGIDHSPSIQNLLAALLGRYEVDLFVRTRRTLRAPVLSSPGLTVVRIREPVSARGTLNAGVRLARASAKAMLTGGRSLPRRLDRWMTVETATRWAASRGHVLHVAIDPQGFLLALKVAPHSRPVAYSLELHLEHDHAEGRLDAATVLARREVMAAERAAKDRIAGLIIQSEEREALFRRDYGMPDSLPVFHLPVTYDEPSDPRPSDWIHRHHGLEPGVPVAIHLGGMNEWFASLEIARAFAVLGEWKLFFQGLHERGYRRRFENEQRRGGLANSIVSTRVVDDLRELDPILRSALVGIAWYEDWSLNMSTAGFSSGKIAAYLKHGLPVVAKRYPSTTASVEDPGCGLCVGTVGEIPDAMRRISTDLEGYRTAALAEYDRRYDFSRYRGRLLEFMATCEEGDHAVTD